MGDVEKRKSMDDDPSLPSKKMKSESVEKETLTVDGSEGNKPDTSSHVHIGLSVSSQRRDAVLIPESQKSNNENEASRILEEADGQPGLKDWQHRSTVAMSWIQSQIMAGMDPRDLLKEIMPCITHIPQDVSPLALWNVIIDILNEPERRRKLPDVNSVSDVIRLIQQSKKILVLTGAGVSVSCGIPDFRSRDGIYARLAVDFPDLPDPQAMFDVSYFTRDPRPFFKFAKEIYPGKFKPSRSHRFISLLQKTGRLLRNYTQNIDTLEQVAGITNVIQCHGSFATASCFKCKYQVDCEAIREDIFNQTIPRCPKCPPDEVLGILKPDIVFFGESLPDKFHRQMSLDQHEADLLIVIGSSLKVRPVALIPTSLPDHIPQILINREPLPHMQFDVELLGDSDTIIGELCRRLGQDFLGIANECNPLSEIITLPDESYNQKNVMKTAEDNNKPSRSSLSSETYEPTNILSSSHFPETSAEQSNHKIDDGTRAHSSNQSEHVQDGALLDADQLSQHPNELSNNHTKCDQVKSTVECSLNKDGSENLFPSSDYPSAGSPGTSLNNAKKAKVRPLWKSRWKQSLSKRLPDGTFYYDGNHRYIFPGAEVAPEEMESDSSSDEYESSSTSDKSSDESDSERPDSQGPKTTELSPSSSGCESSLSLSTMSSGVQSAAEDKESSLTSPLIQHTQDEKTREQLTPSTSQERDSTKDTEE